MSKFAKHDHEHLGYLQTPVAISNLLPSDVTYAMALFSGNVTAKSTDAAQVKIGAVGPGGTPEAGIMFGSSADTGFFRGAASRIDTADVLRFQTPASANVIEIYRSGDTQPRFRVTEFGDVYFGNGSATTFGGMTRGGANIIQTLNSEFRVSRSGAGDLVYSAIVSGDSNLRMAMNMTGFDWGPGSAGFDVRLIRHAAGVIDWRKPSGDTGPVFRVDVNNDRVEFGDGVTSFAELAGISADLLGTPDRFRFGVPDSAIADGSLANSTASFYLNEAGNTLTVKVKYAAGTVKTGTIALA